MTPIEMIRAAVPQLTARERDKMGLHQSSKTQADLAAYMAGYEFGVADMLAFCERVLADG